MIAREIITNDILPLRPDDNCAQAMTMMSVYHVSNLPVVQDNKLLGIVSEDDVTTTDPNKLIKEFRLNHSFIFVTEDEHIFEIIGKIALNKISTMPVLDREENYLGLITQEQIISYYANTYGLSEPGSIIVIKTTKSDYSLSEITRVIEMEGAIVIASFVTSLSSTSSLLITLKISQLEISKVISALERYDYDIHATFSEDEYESDLKSRYDLLMTYLNV